MSVVGAVLGPDGALARVQSSYEIRPEQIEMSEAVLEALTRGGVLLVEAGTGTGKTLAYLTAAVASGARVVISTGTRNLQDQIVDQDIPLLERALAKLGGEVSAACLKGLGNYLCLRKLDMISRSAPLLAKDDVELLGIIARWAEVTETGDRAELIDLPENVPLWSELCSSSETRLGPKCPFFEDCFVTAARRAAQQARIVVVNHYLFFADLALRDGAVGVLPDYEAVIFDEAHQIDDIATEFFGHRVSSRQIARLIRDCEGALISADEGAKDLLKREEHLLDGLAIASKAFFASIAEPPAAQGAATGRHPLEPEKLDELSEKAYFRLDAALEALHSSLKGLATIDESVATCARRAEDAREDLGEILGAQRSTSVYWKEVGRRSAAVGASPVDVSEVMREQVFFQIESVVLTSATLTSDGSFDFTEERLGIDFEPTELVLDSPFDFEKQAALFLPRDAPDPRREGYLKALSELIVKTIDVVDGGALVLFTSYRDMQRVARLVRPELTRLVRVQGERPRRTLLEELRSGSEPMALLGTASFWQGVDVPGEALEAVVIARLPFASPAAPLIAARLGQIEESGRSPFKEYQIPQAGLARKQGFGRLIRSRGDRGVVAIFDGRARTMGYGKVFIRSLPPASRVETLDELREWWGRGG